MRPRGLLNKQSFSAADMLNFNFVNNSQLFPYWYATPTLGGPAAYDPFTQDTQFYGGDGVVWDTTQTPPIPTYYGAPSLYVWYDAMGNQHTLNTGTGLPVAYDPLWRQQSVDPTNPNPLTSQGVYLDPLNAAGQGIPESRFGSGVGFIRNDPDGSTPSVHGLQRLTNFNRPGVMPSAVTVPYIFVSPEDVVLQDPGATTYGLSGAPLNLAALPNTPGFPVVSPSPVIPNLSTPTSPGSPNNDWRYSWMLTVQQTNVPPVIGPNQSSLGATFDGNVVIFENRRFGISLVASPLGGQAWQVNGETVVEAIWGYSASVLPAGGPGYGAGADRTVLLRWPSGMPDPVVKTGDWIADVTYERNWNLVLSRYLNGWGNPTPPYVGLPNPVNNNEWDNLPAQRCFWYQVQRVTQSVPDANVANHRSMVVYVYSPLQARTVLDGTGQPVHLNAALICPTVINVIPQTFTVR